MDNSPKVNDQRVTRHGSPENNEFVLPLCLGVSTYKTVTPLATAASARHNAKGISTWDEYPENKLAGNISDCIEMSSQTYSAQEKRAYSNQQNIMLTARG